MPHPWSLRFMSATYNRTLLSPAAIRGCLRTQIGLGQDLIHLFCRDHPNSATPLECDRETTAPPTVVQFRSINSGTSSSGRVS
jgi:hypothetical protein